MAKQERTPEQMDLDFGPRELETPAEVVEPKTKQSTGSGEIDFYTGPDEPKPQGTENFDYVPETEDIQLPYIRLAQGLTPEVTEGKARPGQWILPDGTLSETITGVVIGMRRVRAYREDQELLCRSLDSVMGIGDPGGPCEQCPLSQWVQGKDGKNVPPKCTLSYQYLMEYGDEESGGIGVVSMSTRSASRVAAQVNLHVRMHGFRAFQVTLGSASVVKGARKFQTPTLNNVTVIKKQLGVGPA